MTQAEAFEKLAARLEHARREHPKFAPNAGDAWWVIQEELAELGHAIDNEGPGRVIDEALDVAATAMRLVMGEGQG